MVRCVAACADRKVAGYRWRLLPWAIAWSLVQAAVFGMDGNGWYAVVYGTFVS